MAVHFSVESMLKVLRHNRFGPPDQVLELVEEADPALAPGQVRIRIEATSIHAGDLKNIAGEMIMVRNPTGGANLAVPLPQTPGIEGVGRIIEGAGDIAGLTLGQRVFLPIQCGSWREALVAEARTLIPAPEGDPVQLSLMVNALTADLALRDLVALSPGDWVIQNGANSNVGRVLIALARLRGFRTVNVVRRLSVESELRALGADVVVLDGDGLAERVSAATGGAAIPLGLDGVAGPATGRLAECVADDGMVANYGLMSGEPCHIEPWMLMYKRLTLCGYYMGYHRRRRPHAEQAAIIAELADLIVKGVLPARIAATYPLERYREAVRHAAREGAERDGKVVFDLRREA